MAWNAQLPDYFKQFDATGGSLSANVPDTMGTQSNPLASSTSDQLQNQNQSQLDQLQSQISQLMGSSSSAISPATATANTTPALTSAAAIPDSLSTTPSTPGAGTTTTTTTPDANSVVIPPIPNQATVTQPTDSTSTGQATDQSALAQVSGDSSLAEPYLPAGMAPYDWLSKSFLPAGTPNTEAGIKDYFNTKYSTPSTPGELNTAYINAITSPQEWNAAYGPGGQYYGTTVASQQVMLDAIPALQAGWDPLTNSPTNASLPGRPH